MSQPQQHLEYANWMAGRLRALARTQAPIVRVADVVRDERSARACCEARFTLNGPDVALSPNAALNLSLAVHELTVNAFEYGALSVPNGKVSVEWITVERHGTPWLLFDWMEEGVPESRVLRGRPQRRGFGRELIEDYIPYVLGGVGRLLLLPGAVHGHLAFPVDLTRT